MLRFLKDAIEPLVGWHKLIKEYLKQWDGSRGRHQLDKGEKRSKFLRKHWFVSLDGLGIYFWAF